MKHSLAIMFCCLIFFPVYSVNVARCQPTENKPKDWLDILRNDPRLKTPLTLKFESKPGADELLNILRKATGVALTLADEPKAEQGKIVLGDMKGKAPAWKVMEQIVATQFTDGKWEKAGDGYYQI